MAQTWFLTEEIPPCCTQLHESGALWVRTWQKLSSLKTENNNKVLSPLQASPSTPHQPCPQRPWCCHMQEGLAHKYATEYVQAHGVRLWRTRHLRSCVLGGHLNISIPSIFTWSQHGGNLLHGVVVERSHLWFIWFISSLKKDSFILTFILVLPS